MRIAAGSKEVGPYGWSHFYVSTANGLFQTMPQRIHAAT